MQFLVLGYDGEDSQALDRRMAVRNAHIALGNELVSKGHLLFGVAILNEDKKMIGSAFIAEFSSRADLDAWLKVEPYITGDVWRRVEISPCRVGPSFEHLMRSQVKN